MIRCQCSGWSEENGCCKAPITMSCKACGCVHSVNFQCKPKADRARLQAEAAQKHQSFPVFRYTAQEEHQPSPYLARLQAEDEQKHQPLPVVGYTAQSQSNVATADALKFAEERYLRLLDALAARGDVDGAMVQLSRRHLQTATMFAVRSVFQPQRAKLPEDNSDS